MIYRKGRNTEIRRPMESVKRMEIMTSTLGQMMGGVEFWMLKIWVMPGVGRGERSSLGR